MEPKTVIGKPVQSQRRILRVTGKLWGTGEQKTHDYNLPNGMRLFKSAKDVKMVAGEFYSIDSAEVIDEFISVQANTTKII